MNTRKTKSFFALVLVFFMFLPAFALSEVPSVSLGAGSLLPGNTVWLGFYSVGHEDGNGEQIRSEETDALIDDAVVRQGLFHVRRLRLQAVHPQAHLAASRHPFRDPGGAAPESVRQVNHASGSSAEE